MTKPRRVTIRDVAAVSGFSVTTVSHALNGVAGVNAETRAQVIAVAERLGFRANRAARALQSGRTGAIALQLPTGGDWSRNADRDRLTAAELFTADYYMRMTAGVARGVFESDYSLLLIPSIESVSAFTQLDVDGCIVCDPTENDSRISVVDTARIPLVTVGRDPARPEREWFVRSDVAGNMRQLLDHLISAGATRIAVLAWTIVPAWVAENVAVYNQWCRENDTEPRIELAESLSSGHEACLRALKRTPQPDAIVTLLQGSHEAVLRAARDADRRVPEDLLVACCVDGPLAAASVPSVTAIDLAPDIQGTAAATLLIARLRGDESRRSVVTDATLQIRESSCREAAAVPLTRDS